MVVLARAFSVAFFLVLFAMRGLRVRLTSCQLLSENVSSKKTSPAAETTEAMANDASKSVAFMLIRENVYVYM